MFFKEGEEVRQKGIWGLPMNKASTEVSVTFYISPVPLRYHLHAMEKQVKNKQVNSMLW